MNETKPFALVLAALAGLAAITAPAAARNGADDKADHVRQCRGCDDAPGHIRQARGADDRADHVRRNRGGEEATADDRGRGRGQGRGRGGDDNPGKV